MVEEVISLDGNWVRKYANGTINVERDFERELEKEILSEARNNGVSENRCGVISSATLRFDFPLLPNGFYFMKLANSLLATVLDHRSRRC